MMLYPIMYYVLWNGIVTIIKVTKPYNDRRNLCFKVACGDYFKAYLTSAVITVTM